MMDHVHLLVMIPPKLSISQFIGYINPIRYRGYFFDNETSLYYLNARYYDPKLRRFISPDTFSILDDTMGEINGLNLYMYCKDNPVMYTDDSGSLAIICSILIGAFIGLATSYIQDVAKNFKDGFEWSDFNTFGNNNWKKYIGAAIGGAIGGLRSDFISTIAFNGIGNVVESAINGGINSFGEFMTALTIGCITSAIGYGISKGITKHFADKKILNALGNLFDNSKVNKKLATMGFKKLKIGKNGFNEIYSVLYEKFGFDHMKTAIYCVMILLQDCYFKYRRT